MDRKIIVLGTGLILTLLLGSFFLIFSKTSKETTSTPTTIPAIENNTNQESPSESSEPTPKNLTINSKMLAKNYFVYEKAEYEKTRAANRPILLFFYANWCPTCARQEPINLSTFNNLEATNLVVFRVNYNDSDTSKDEDSLAKDLGITYQHKFRLFDSKGNLIDSFEGDTSESALVEKISKVN